ncbi:D-galactonate dehydratase, partial [Escherichia coli]
HGRVRRPVAKALAKALAPFDPMFYEELLLPEHNDALREVARDCAVPLATGERLFTRWQFKELLQEGVVDIV